jgi:integrase
MRIPLPGIGVVVNLKVEDYFQTGKRSLIRFKEKGGKEKEIPVHHKLEEILDEYLKVAKLREKPDAPLFPTTLGKSRALGSRPMTRFDGGQSPEATIEKCRHRGRLFTTFFQSYRHHELPRKRRHP